MLTFIMRRLIQTVIVLILVSFIAFSLLHLIPGDPVVTMLGTEATQAQIDALRSELGLDRPLIAQYVKARRRSQTKEGRRYLPSLFWGSVTLSAYAEDHGLCPWMNA